MSLCGTIRQSGCMIVLAEYGADVNIRNDDGYTVFELPRPHPNQPPPPRDPSGGGWVGAPPPPRSLNKNP